MAYKPSRALNQFHTASFSCRWNKPKHQSKLETKTNGTSQQRELEMETFLHKDHPMENGKAAEYTVIPLDELSEKYPSH